MLFLLGGCVPMLQNTKTENKSVPASFNHSTDTATIAKLQWKDYFSDPNLIALIDTALKNNQELNIVKQEIAINKNEVMARKGEYLPFLGLMGSSGYEKIGKYTWRGGVEENINLRNNPRAVESNSDFLVGAFASWELDVWKKLRNSKKAAFERYLASIDGRNFLVTTLIAEIANSYYELMALDNLLDIIQRNIVIQSDALKVVGEQKDAAKVTQLAVNRFQAQLLNSQNLQYEIKQKITETENRIHFLTTQFPKPIPRSSADFYNLTIDSVQAGIPSQLLVNRPDVRQAERELVAAKLDVAVARANFYPSFRITAQSGFQAFNPIYLVNPGAIIYNLAGEFVAPIVNRNAIKATYFSANAKQIQAAFRYEQTILNSHLEVMNELAKIDNYSKSYATKSKEVNILNQSVTIANNLFNAARADYAEVLFTQREALDSKMELIEIRMKQLNAKVGIYRALGGGW
jgi:NodT family efflux transporter outer membrane factor (OMF) lipoprotein